MKHKSNIQFFKSLSSSYLQFAIVTLVGLWLTPYVLSYLTKKEYGIFVVFIDLIAWISIIEITNGVLQSRLVHYYAENNLEEATKLAVSAFWFQFLVAVLILIISIILALNPQLLFNQDENILYLKESFILIAIASCVDLVGRTYTSIVVATKKIYIDNYINILVFIFRVVLIVIFLQEGFRILSLAIANLIASIVSLLIKSYKVRSIGFSFSLYPKNISLDKIRFLYNNGKWFTLGTLAGLLIFNTDKIIAGKVLGLDFVTVYAITLKLYDVSEKILSKVISVSRPFIGDIYAKKEYAKFAELFIFMDQIYTLVVWIVGFGVFVISSCFIKWWVGPNFYGGDLLSFFMFLNFSLQAMVMPKRAYLASTLYEVKKQNIARVFEGIINLILSITLVHYYGLIGLVIGSAIATLIGSNITYSFFVKKLLNKHGFILKYSKMFWFVIGVVVIGSIYLLYTQKIHDYSYSFGFFIIYIFTMIVYIYKYMMSNMYMKLIVTNIRLLRFKKNNES